MEMSSLKSIYCTIMNILIQIDQLVKPLVAKYIKNIYSFLSCGFTPYQTYILTSSQN